MVNGTQEIIPNADFSTLGLGRIVFTDEEIAVAEIASLSAWIDPATYWATGMVEAAPPLDRTNLARIWVKNGAPTVAAGINGKPTWRTPGGTNASYSNAGNILPAGSDWTVCFPAKPAVAGTLMFPVGSTSSSNYFAVERDTSGGIKVFANSTQVINFAASWTTTAKHVQVAYNHTTKVMTLLVDGIVRATATLAADQINLTLGVCYTGAGSTTYAWNGDVGEVLVFAADLSATAHAEDQATVVGYMRGKYDLA